MIQEPPGPKSRARPQGTRVRRRNGALVEVRVATVPPRSRELGMAQRSMAGSATLVLYLKLAGDGNTLGAASGQGISGPGSLHPPMRVPPHMFSLPFSAWSTTVRYHWQCRDVVMAIFSGVYPNSTGYYSQSRLRVLHLVCFASLAYYLF
mgnify:CR=1 FL=1